MCAAWVCYCAVITECALIISQCAPARVAIIPQSEPADAFVVTPGRLAYRAVTIIILARVLGLEVYSVL